jgi:hemolysin-activating ACP:hemolysin acyltransferase
VTTLEKKAASLEAIWWISSQMTCCYFWSAIRNHVTPNTKNKQNSVALNPRANYTDWATVKSQIHDSKLKDVNNQHLHLALWNSVHWLPKYASHYYNCCTNSSTSPGNYGSEWHT